MRVLAVDTSSELCGVACLVGGELRSELSARVRSRHGETIFALMGQALEHAGLGRRELDLVACGLGPGTFTGTRVGVATAKGLALALGVPLSGVCSLRAIARGVEGPLVAPVVDAYRGEVYAAVYERAEAGAALVERVAPFSASPEEVRERLAAVGEVRLCGSGTRRYGEVLPPACSPLLDLPRAALVALEALERYRRRGPDDLAALEPCYVRPSDARLPPGAQPIDS